MPERDREDELGREWELEDKEKTKEAQGRSDFRETGIGSHVPGQWSQLRTEVTVGFGSMELLQSNFSGVMGMAVVGRLQEGTGGRRQSAW